MQQNPDEAVWFDVGVFKTLFSEVSHYFLPADSDQTTAAISSRPPNTKEVKYCIYYYCSCLCGHIMNSLTHTSSDSPLLSSRGSCPGLGTTRAERSRSWPQVRPTGSESQESTTLARETSAQSVSSRPANLVSLERPLLSKLPRWHIKDIQIEQEYVINGQGNF